MIWFQNKEYKRLPAEEREVLIYNMASPSFGEVLRILSISLNIAAPLILLFIFKFNLVQLSLAFVAFDFVMQAFDQFFFVYLPFKLNKTFDAEKSLRKQEKLKDYIDKMSEKIKAFQKRHNCDCCRGLSCFRCNKINMYIDKKDALKDALRAEERYYKKNIEAIKKKEMDADNRKSDDFDNKIDFLINSAEKLDCYLEDHDIEALKPIIMSLLNLSTMLKEKPFALKMVSTTTYLYINELLEIMNTWTSLPYTSRQKYMDDIAKIASELSLEVDSIAKRVESAEIEGIEVSISVLLQELQKNKEESDV